MHEREWSLHGFDEYSALAVTHAGLAASGVDVYDFYINVDNRFLRLAQKESIESPNNSSKHDSPTEWSCSDSRCFSHPRLRQSTKLLTAGLSMTLKG